MARGSEDAPLLNTAPAPGKLLAVGGFRKVQTKSEHPTLYHFVGSFNSGKATFAAQISSKAPTFELKYTLHMRDNYSLEYARLNPDTMAVPTLRMDEYVFTDSYDMIKYLQETCPGKGDQFVAADPDLTEKMASFIELARSWDEYMFTYGHMGESNSEMANGIRLVFLRKSLKRVLDEKPTDAEFLTNAYIKKLAGINIMKLSQLEGAEKQRRLAENITLLHQVLRAAENILEQGGNPKFLFGEQLTTGDVYILPIFRIFHIAVPQFWKENRIRYPRLDAYWDRAQKDPDVNAGLMQYVSKLTMLRAMLGSGVPCLIVKWICGFLRAPKLPSEIEARIAAATEELWAKS